MRTIIILLLVFLITACVDSIPNDTTGDGETTQPSDTQEESSDPAPDETDSVAGPPNDVPKNAFRGDYYQGQSFDEYISSRTDDAISFDFELSAPLEGMEVDYFSIRWTGRFEFEDDTYTFTARVDDGIRLFVDDELVLESWKNQPATTYSEQVELSAGEHTITVEYYEAYATASVDVTWEPTPAPSKPTPSDPCDGCVAHEQLLDELVGFGQATTGGKGGAVYTVNSLADSGPGTLRDALTRTEPLWIRFGVSGTIALASPIQSASDKTIDGRGADVTISNHGIYITGKENVIITNMRFSRPSDDAIRIYNGARNVWVHHNDITAGWKHPDDPIGDGAIDVTERSTGVTISYNHIFDWDKSMLVGGSCDDYQECDGRSFRGTFHHNWYDDTRQRLPMVRHGWAHSYNNLFNWYGGYALDAHTAPAQLVSENDIFEPRSGVDNKAITSASGTYVRISGAYEKPFGSGLILTERSPQSAFDPNDHYDYTAMPANAQLEAYIKANAGWQDVPWPE